MYMVAFMYPSAEGSEFNFDHFVNVHLPLGVGLTYRHLKIKPRRIVAYSPIWGGDGDSASAPFSAISSVFFDTATEAETFLGLFEVEEAARLLSADFPNYTPGPPDTMMAKVSELTDMDELIRKFHDMENAA